MSDMEFTILVDQICEQVPYHVGEALRYQSTFWSKKNRIARLRTFLANNNYSVIFQDSKASFPPTGSIKF